MSVINKIKDFFGIEHHELHETRIVQMKNGDYVVQEWYYTRLPHDPSITIGNPEWQEASLLIDPRKFIYRSGRCFTLEEAKEFKKKFDAYMTDKLTRNVVDKVVV